MRNEDKNIIIGIFFLASIFFTTLLGIGVGLDLEKMNEESEYNSMFHTLSSQLVGNPCRFFGMEFGGTRTITENGTTLESYICLNGNETHILSMDGWTGDDNGRLIRWLNEVYKRN